MRPDALCTNVDTIGADLVNLMLDTSNNLTVTASIALHKAQPELNALLQRLAAAVQLPSEIFVDVDFVALAAACDALQYLDRCAGAFFFLIAAFCCFDQACTEVWGWILGGLTANLESACADDLVQGAMAEAWTTGALRLILDANMRGWSCDFLDGDLIITGNPESVATNVGEIGKDLVDKL